MGALSKILLTLVMIPVLFMVLPTMFDFFGVPAKYYMIYVIWILALLVLNAILTSRPPNMFTPIVNPG